MLGLQLRVQGSMQAVRFAGVAGRAACLYVGGTLKCWACDVVIWMQASGQPHASISSSICISSSVHELAMTIVTCSVANCAHLPAPMQAAHMSASTKLCQLHQQGDASVLF